MSNQKRNTELREKGFLCEESFLELERLDEKLLKVEEEKVKELKIKLDQLLFG